MFSIILTYRRSFVHDFEAEEWSKEKKNECSAWLDVNYLPVDSMSPIIMLLYSYLFCLVWHGMALFCFVYKSEIITQTALKLKKLKNERMEKETAVVSMPLGSGALCWLLN